MELAYFGAKVIHPQTMAPAVAKQIPIWIRNTFAPEKAGTLICAAPESSHAVKGITSIDKVALVNVEGAGMIGVPGTAQRLFGALREDGISVILISQGSSEHSICFAVLDADAERTERTVRRAFAAELRDGQIQSVDVLRACSILSVVGDGMAGTPGIAAKVFAALAGAGVNVRAIAQGSSERNISVVIDDKPITRALRAVHAAFYLSPHTVSIGVVGPGVVGRTLLKQMWSQVPRLLADFNLDLRIRALMTSKRMLLAEPAVNASTLAGRSGRRPAGGRDRVRRARARRPHPARRHHRLLGQRGRGGAVSAMAGGRHPRGHAEQARQQRSAEPCTPACTRRGAAAARTTCTRPPSARACRSCRRCAICARRATTSVRWRASSRARWRICSTCGTARSRSPSIVRDAKAKGYTEPDPRDDLSGTDVARKLVILARELGMKLELSDVALEGLIPASLSGCSVDDFMARLDELDAPMAAQLTAARAQDQVLRYVAALDAASGRATVGLVRLDRGHPFANINLTDNVVRFVTSRYDVNPLVVQGPGAGPQVTAAGVFADVLRVCAYLGAKI